MKPTHAEMKSDFTESTYQVIASFNNTITPVEYSDFLVRSPTVLGKDDFFIVLESCPRNQGAIRTLHERVNTRVDVCTNPYAFWCKRTCDGSKSMNEPNLIVGPFSGAKQRQKKKEMLIKSKAAVVDARGIPQRLACLMEFARQHGAWAMAVIPPVLSSTHLTNLFNVLEDRNHDGIFAKTDADA